ELAVHRVQHVLGGELLVLPVRHDAGGGVPAEEVVDGGGHLERALVAVPAHGVHPAGVHHARPEDAGGLLVQRAGADRLGPGGVADVRGGRGAGERADGGHHPAVVLVVVVGVGDVVLAGVGVLGRHRDPPVGRLHRAAGGHAVEAAAVGVAAPGGVDLGEVLVVAPATRLHQLQEPRPVGARLRPEDPDRAVAVVVGPHEVQVGGLVQA